MSAQVQDADAAAAAEAERQAMMDQKRLEQKMRRKTEVVQGPKVNLKFRQRLAQEGHSPGKSSRQARKSLASPVLGPSLPLAKGNGGMGSFKQISLNGRSEQALDLAIPEDAVVEVPLSPGGSASTLAGINEGEGSIVEDPDAVPFYETSSFQFAMGMATVYALVGEDLMKLTCPPEVDDVFYVLLFMTFLMFCFEMVILATYMPGYLPDPASGDYGMFFWYDFLGTITIILDISWIWDPLSLALGASESVSDTSDDLQLAKGAKAARVGSKAARIVKMVKLVRFFRLFKVMRVVRFFKNFGRKEIKEDARRRDPLEDSTFVFKEDQKPSAIGLRLSEKLSRQVVFVILGVIITYPLLQYDEIDMSRYVDLNILEFHEMSGPSSDSGFFAQYERFSNDPSLIVLGLSGAKKNYTMNRQSSFPTLRSSEIIYEVSKNRTIYAAFEDRGNALVTAGKSLIMTLFTCMLLVTSSYMFNQDAMKLIVKPIERMTKVINKVCKTLALLRQDVDRAHKEANGFEIDYIESSITKMAGLLRVGFGEAGAKILFQNFNSEDSLDAVLPGVKVNAIFGFCDIRRFTDTTEILQEKVMLFVNSIANIVHLHCTSTDGHPNKNVGDAFLLVWKKHDTWQGSDDQTQEIRNDGKGGANAPGAEAGSSAAASSENKDKGGSGRAKSIEETRRQWQQIADGAMRCIMRIISEMESLNAAVAQEKLAGNDGGKVWRTHMFLELEHIRTCRAAMEGYVLRLGFGLHYGWAIEGAIGSRTKIDASYLSPHVAKAEDLEGLTKKYGVDYLMSDSFVSLLPDEERSEFRKVDEIFLGTKEDGEVLGLYAHDLLDLYRKVLDADGKPPTDLKLRWTDENTSQYGIRSNERVAAFLKQYEFGVAHYLDGQWDQAKERLKKALQMHPKDGPSSAILNFIEAHGKPPAEWAGMRNGHKHLDMLQRTRR